MRTVLKNTRSGKKQASIKQKRNRMRPDLVFSFALVVMVALPLSLYAIKSRESIKTIVISPGEATSLPVTTSQTADNFITPPPSEVPTASPTSASEMDVAALISESEAIHIARECFNAQCDTSIFSFEEYEVGVTLNNDAAPQYIVKMESIYKNGCNFSVILSAQSGEVLQYSTPRMATIPAYVDSTSAEVRAWHDKYGEFLFTWPQDVQAEFSRRYQGASLRTAKEGEISYEAAIAAVSAPIMEQSPGLFNAFYPVLYSERSSGENRAYYVVYCYAQEVTDALPEGEPMIVSFDAVTGDIISIEGNPFDSSLTIDSIVNAK